MPNPLYVQRMQEEHDQLCDRVGKLKIFLSTPTFQGLDDERKRLLRMQYTLMLGYLSVLADRINLELQ